MMIVTAPWWGMTLLDCDQNAIKTYKSVSVAQNLDGAIGFYRLFGIYNVGLTYP